jgi:hypothetical protein
MTTKMVVRPGDATASMVKEAWDEILGEVGKLDGDSRSTVESYEVDPDTLARASVDVKQDEGDFGITFLVIVGAPVAVHVLNSLWDDLVRPRLRSKFGVDGGPHVD